jgi:hypothetical protein
MDVTLSNSSQQCTTLTQRGELLSVDLESNARLGVLKNLCVFAFICQQIKICQYTFTVFLRALCYGLKFDHSHHIALSEEFA